MNIAIYVHNLTGGGAEHVAALWARGFVDNNHNVSVIVHSVSENDYPLPPSVKLYILKSIVEKRRFRQIRQIRELRRTVRTIRPDVLITVMHPTGLYALLSTIGMRIPIINTEHNAFERPQEKKWSKFEIFQKFYLNRLFYRVTVLTKADKTFIGNRLKNVRVLPNPLAFDPCSEIKKDKKIVLSMGRLDGWYVKGFDLLIAAWRKVQDSYPDWKLKIAGTGPDSAKQKLLDLCKEYGVRDSIEFLGFCNNPIELYRDASIFVFSSRCDGFGLVLIEAMSQGCACVACDYKGRQKEIIDDGISGLICDTNNSNQIADRINLLISNTNLRKTIQEQSVVRAADFSLECIMKEWEKILKEL